MVNIYMKNNGIYLTYFSHLLNNAYYCSYIILMNMTKLFIDPINGHRRVTINTTSLRSFPTQNNDGRQFGLYYAKYFRRVVIY